MFHKMMTNFDNKCERTIGHGGCTGHTGQYNKMSLKSYF